MQITMYRIVTSNTSIQHDGTDKMFAICFDDAQAIQHYGVLGMKWGVRRYQDKNGRLTEAGKKQLKYNRAVKKAKDSGKAKTDNIENFNVGLFTFTNKNYPDEHWESALAQGHDWDWNEVTKVGEDSYVSSAYVTRHQEGTDELYNNQQMINSSMFSENGGRDGARFLGDANPTYGAPGTTNNCAKCSSTMELMLQGYTGIAAGRSSGGCSNDCEERWWNGAKVIEYSSANDAQSSIQEFGAGTSGTIDIRYASGGGHKMHWSVSNDGVFSVNDGQNGRRFTSVDEMCYRYGADQSKGVRICRLDNCTPNWDNMAADGVIRSSNSSESKVWNKYNQRIVDTW